MGGFAEVLGATFKVAPLTTHQDFFRRLSASPGKQRSLMAKCLRPSSKRLPWIFCFLSTCFLSAFTTLAFATLAFTT